MPAVDESCVLIPCHTLEDFPTQLPASQAEGLLAAWTAPWHPALIAASGKIPAWYRADTPPAPAPGRLFFVPEAANDMLPRDFSQTHSESAGGRVVRGDDRAALLASTQLATLGLIPSPVAAACGSPHHGNPDGNGDDAPAVERATDGPPPPTLHEGHRPVGPDDFFALGYTMLQVQLMTRRLRYTSNLDEIHFAELTVAAASAWCQGDGKQAAESLHRAFDVLAEERDHYFASDPHLIDLTLLTEAMLGDDLERTLREPGKINLLLSATLAERLAAGRGDLVTQIRQRIEEETLGTAGGAPGDDVSLGHLTAAATGQWLADGARRFQAVFGRIPDAFARYDGGAPGDLAQWLVPLGYRGAVPIDFAGGTGFRDESKLNWQSGAAEIEALVAQPIDAAAATGFLAIGAALGSAVDSGDVASALLVHWPGHVCDAYRDLRRAAQWGLALGRFWTLGGFFRDGESPYHSFRGEAADAQGRFLEAQVQAGQPDPLSAPAARCRSQVADEAGRVLAATEALLAGTAVDAAPDDDGGLAGVAARLARRLGGAAGGTGRPRTTIINPHSAAIRVAVLLDGPPPEANTPVFAADAIGGRKSIAFVDVPAHGFATVAPAAKTRRGGWLRLRRPKPIASGRTLANEFMEVIVAPGGGIASVHSGSVRGNRFSLQLCRYDAAAAPDSYSTMQCDRIEVAESSAARGEIVSQGRLLRADATVGSYEVRYRLDRGSRLLRVAGTVRVSAPLDADPWRSYCAARVAVASEASTVKAIVRDKLHGPRGRRLDAPLGVIIDEGDRKLMVVTDGRPAHRTVGHRFLDSLLTVAGENESAFVLHYGFDVKDPVSIARSLLAPPVILPASSAAPAAASGWLMRVDSRRVVVTDARVETDDQGQLNVVALLVETSGRAVQTQLHFARDPSAARRTRDQRELEIDRDAVKIALVGHEVTEIRVAFGS